MHCRARQALRSAFVSWKISDSGVRGPVSRIWNRRISILCWAQEGPPNTSPVSLKTADEARLLRSDDIFCSAILGHENATACHLLNDLVCLFAQQESVADRLLHERFHQRHVLVVGTVAFFQRQARITA